MKSSIHFDKKGKDILILGKGPTQGLGENPLTAEKCIQLVLLWQKKEILFKFAL